MYVHKELKNLLWFRPVTTEVHVDFAAPSAFSAYSHPGPGSAKCWSCLSLWRVGDATDVRWKCLTPVPSWGSTKNKKKILTASKYRLRQVSCYLRHSRHWLWFMPDNLILATIDELLMGNNLGPSSCFPHLWYASTQVLVKSPICLKHWFPTNQVKGRIKHPTSGGAEVSWWMQVAHPAARLEENKR